MFSSLQLQSRQSDRGLTGTQWKGLDTTWSANPQAQGSMLVSTIPRTRTCHFIQQQLITILLRAEGTVEVEMPTGPGATTSTHKT